jgi:hypothetical protein
LLYHSKQNLGGKGASDTCRQVPLLVNLKKLTFRVWCLYRYLVHATPPLRPEIDFLEKEQERQQIFFFFLPSCHRRVPSYSLDFQDFLCNLVIEKEKFVLKKDFFKLKTMDYLDIFYVLSQNMGKH